MLICHLGCSRDEVDAEGDVVGTISREVAGSQVESVVLLKIQHLGRSTIIVIIFIILLFFFVAISMTIHRVCCSALIYHHHHPLRMIISSSWKTSCRVGQDYFQKTPRCRTLEMWLWQWPNAISSPLYQKCCYQKGLLSPSGKSWSTGDQWLSRA